MFFRTLLVYLVHCSNACTRELVKTFKYLYFTDLTVIQELRSWTYDEKMGIIFAGFFVSIIIIFCIRACIDACDGCREPGTLLRMCVVCYWCQQPHQFASYGPVIVSNNRVALSPSVGNQRHYPGEYALHICNRLTAFDLSKSVIQD